MKTVTVLESAADVVETASKLKMKRYESLFINEIGSHRSGFVGSIALANAPYEIRGVSARDLLKHLAEKAGFNVTFSSLDD